ncbi:MAG TPA: NAD(P)/FAD-dependent oxidoreductase [Spirochaetota bacterium]|nr:NAD(P)/FAD-dependent oxidoreductase [Spirochaetota bacterium]
MPLKRVAVIGAGASGLIASWFAADSCEVVLYEKEKKIARKLLVTGNGRCNISNVNADRTRYHGHNPDFVRNVLAAFSIDDTISFFESIGIPFIEEDEGRLYPASLQSSIVLKVFEYELAKKNVDIRLHKRIEKIIPEKNRFRLVTAGMEEEVFDSVILSCGSCAFTSVGASTIGYDLARSLKHKVFEPFPVILPLNIPAKAVHRMQGVKWDCGLKVYLDGRVLAQSEDELLFTPYGISGPAALKISRAVNEAVIEAKHPEISIDFFPQHEITPVQQLVESVTSDSAKKLSFALMGILKDHMPDVILELSGIKADMRCGSMTMQDKKKLAETLKDFRVQPGKPRGFSEAVAAAGGVDVSQVYPATMESKIVKNLYITGELLDIDGESGGYNLQFAWSTGALAGRAQ